MPAQFPIPLVTPVPGMTIAATTILNEWLNLYNNLIPAGIDCLSQTDTLYQTTVAPFPGSVISLPTSLLGEIQRLRYQIQALVSQFNPANTYWYMAPTGGIVFINSNGLGIFGTPIQSPLHLFGNTALQNYLVELDNTTNSGSAGFYATALISSIINGIKMQIYGDGVSGTIGGITAAGLAVIQTDLNVSGLLIQTGGNVPITMGINGTAMAVLNSTKLTVNGAMVATGNVQSSGSAVIADTYVQSPNYALPGDTTVTSFDSDGTMAANSNAHLPTQAAVVSYVASQAKNIGGAVLIGSALSINNGQGTVTVVNATGFGLFLGCGWDTANLSGTMTFTVIVDGTTYTGTQAIFSGSPSSGFFGAIITRTGTSIGSGAIVPLAYKTSLVIKCAYNQSSANITNMYGAYQA